MVMETGVEPLAVEFANTVHNRRGRSQDALAEPAGLASWLERHRVALGATAVPDAELDSVTALRDAVRALLAASVDGAPAPAPALALLNANAAAAPHWPVLDADFTVTERSEGAPSARLRATLARETISLLAGPLRPELRACGAPGCIQYFVKDHPRREWCSPACGNRARAARHYYRHRDDA